MKLSKNTYIAFGIFGAIASGLYFDSINMPSTVLPVVLSLLLYANFLKIDFKIKSFYRKELLYFPVIYYVILPTVIYFFTGILGIDNALRIGLVILAMTPAATTSPVVSRLLNADSELVVSQVIITNLMTPLVFTVFLSVYFGASELEMPISMIFLRIAFIIIMPLLLSLFTKKVPILYKPLGKFSNYFVPFVFIFIIFVAVSGASSRLREIDAFHLVVIAVAVFFMAISNYTLGYFLSKERCSRISLALMFGHRNTAIAIWVVMENYELNAVIPLIIYIISHHIINGLMQLFMPARCND